MATLKESLDLPYEGERKKILDSALRGKSDNTKELKLNEEEYKKKIENWRKTYEDYAASQKGFISPVADISLEETDDRVGIIMEVIHNEMHLQFESMKPKYADAVYENLNSNPLVRSQFSNGKTFTREESNKKVIEQSDHFLKKDRSGHRKQINPFSSFVVLDGETRDFIGLTMLSATSKAGKAELARLNSVETWSHLPTEVVAEYVPSLKPKKNKSYGGIGTTETCVMLQYATYLKNKKYTICEKELEEVVSTARVDNPGSWKSNAKAGMKVRDVQIIEEYGEHLRFLLGKSIK